MSIAVGDGLDKRQKGNHTQEQVPGNSLEVQWLGHSDLIVLGSYTAVSFIQNVFPSVVCLIKLCTSLLSIHGQGTNILQAMWHHP